MMTGTRASSIEDGKHEGKVSDVRIERTEDLSDLPDLDADKTPEERAAIVGFMILAWLRPLH